MQLTHTVPANSLLLGRCAGGRPAWVCSTLGQKRSIPMEWSCHSPHLLCSGSHHGVLSSARAGFLLNETEPEEVLPSHTSSTLAEGRQADRNHFVQSSGEHEWTTQHPGKFHTQKGPTPWRRRCPLRGRWTSLELGPSKSPLKCVHGGCQVWSIEGSALQICSYLSTAFAPVNTTSDCHQHPQVAGANSLSVPSFSPPKQLSRTAMGDAALQKTRVIQNKTN